MQQTKTLLDVNENKILNKQKNMYSLLLVLGKHAMAQIYGFTLNENIYVLLYIFENNKP